MIDPLFWLGLSILLVAVSLTAVLVAALPALQELARAARSVEKLADTLNRELPPTLEAIRLTGIEISDLTDDVSQGVKNASQTVKQVNESLSSTKNQAKKLQVNTSRIVTGVKAAWKTWNRPSTGRRTTPNLPSASREAVEPRPGSKPLSIDQALTDAQDYQEGDTDYYEVDPRSNSSSYQDFNRD